MIREKGAAPFFREHWLGALFVPCSGCERQSQPINSEDAERLENQVVVDSDTEIAIGMVSAKVAETVGEPSGKTRGVQNTYPIFGVVRAWWDDLKDGDRIEIRSYSRTKGTFQVYFLNDYPFVRHAAFVGINVVF